MNRRDFLFNAAAGLFVAATPKIIVDMAANTWRRNQINWHVTRTDSCILVVGHWHTEIFGHLFSREYDYQRRLTGMGTAVDYGKACITERFRLERGYDA